MPLKAGVHIGTETRFKGTFSRCPLCLRTTFLGKLSQKRNGLFKNQTCCLLIVAKQNYLIFLRDEYQFDRGGAFSMSGFENVVPPIF